MHENNIKRIQLLGLTCDIETENGTRHFHNGHEYVEIGGVKWATMNVGANSPTEKGLYFQWGDTQGYTTEKIGDGKKCFNWSDYKFFIPNRDLYDVAKYNYDDGKKVLDAEDDAVTVAWGKGWRMPTRNELRGIYYNVNTSCVKNYQGSGVNGFLCTDIKDNTKVVFFPIIGFAAVAFIRNLCSIGYYWSRELYKDDIINASILTFNTLENINLCCPRQFGCQIRGVLDI